MKTRCLEGKGNETRVDSALTPSPIPKPRMAICRLECMRCLEQRSCRIQVP